MTKSHVTKKIHFKNNAQNLLWVTVDDNGIITACNEKSYMAVSILELLDKFCITKIEPVAEDEYPIIPKKNYYQSNKDRQKAVLEGKLIAYQRALEILFTGGHVQDIEVDIKKTKKEIAKIEAE